MVFFHINIFTMSIGQKIKELRKGLGLSQEELGKKVDVDRTNVSAWENDRAEPRWANVKSLAKLFGVSIETLLEDDEQLEPTPGDQGNVMEVAMALVLSEIAELKAEKLGITPEEALKQLMKKGGPTLSGLDKRISLPHH